jgi:catalase (peroxidase I)
MTRVRFSRFAALTLAALATVALTAGCDALGKSGAGAQSPPASSFTVSPRVTAVVIQGGSGSVEVTGSGRSTVSVSQQASYSKTPPRATHVLRGTTLTLSYTCPNELSCSLSYQAQVPRGVAVTVSTSAGSITLTTLAGPVSAKADAGLITAVELRSASATFKTDAGGITATFAAAPRSVSATTDVGPVTLTLPGSARYLVSAHTLVGASTVTVPRGTSAAHSVTAHSDLGVISINPA